MKKFFLLLLILCIIPISCYAFSSNGLHSGDILLIAILLLVLGQSIYEKSIHKFTISKHEINEVPDEYGYSKEELKKILFNNFNMIYDALNKKDLDVLKKLCSSEICDAYYSQFDSLSFLNRKRIIDSFNIKSFKIVDVSREKTRILVTIDADISYYSYIVNKEDVLIKGRKDILINKKMNLVFVKNNIDFDSIRKCPHCLENSRINGKGECINCKKQVVDNKDEFILIKKRCK